MTEGLSQTRGHGGGVRVNATWGAGTGGEQEQDTDGVRRGEGDSTPMAPAMLRVFPRTGPTLECLWADDV